METAKKTATLSIESNVASQTEDTTITTEELSDKEAEAESPNTEEKLSKSETWVAVKTNPPDPNV